MADTKISALTDSAVLDGTEVLPIVQGGATKRTPLSRVLTFILTSLNAQAVPNVADTDPFYFAATGMDANQFVSYYTPSASQVYGVSANAFWSPDYPVKGYRFFFSNWSLRGAAAGTSQEVNGNANIVIEGATLLIGSTRYPLKFSGATGATLTPGQGIWSDELVLTVAPRTKGRVITCWQATTTASGMMGSFYPNAGLGEGFVLASTTQSAYLTSGTVPYTAPGALYAWGPNAAVARGSDGREVVLLSGDSIATGTGEANFASDSRNNRGYPARWLDSTEGGARRIPFAKFCVPSARCAQVTTSADIAKRVAMISALPNLPFTKIVQEMGLNDATGSLATWQSRIITYNTVLKAAWNVPLLQLGFTPYTTFDNTVGTTAAGQTYVVSHDWPSGFTQQVQNALSALPTGVDQFLFVEHVFDGRLAGGVEGKWRSDVFQTNTTLQSAALISATTIVVRGPVALGAALALNAGVAGAQAVSVTGVSGVGNVTCTIFPALTIARAAGETVKGVATQDFLHPSTEMAAYAAAQLASKKQEVFA